MKPVPAPFHPWQAMHAIVLLFFLFLAVSGQLGCSSSTGSHGPQEKTSGGSIVVEVNSKAPGFAANTLDGGSVRLADLLGEHVILLEFWSIFCKSCIEEMPHVETLYEKYREEGLSVLSVNTDVFSSTKVSSFLQKAGITPPYPVLRDARQEIVRSFGVELLPVTVLIDRDGWIRMYQEGYRPGDEHRFESKIRSLLRRTHENEPTLATRDGVTAFAPAGTHLVEPGVMFPQLAMRTIDGDPLQLGDGRPYLAYFWSLYCSPCRSEYKTVAELAERYAGRELVAISINVDSARLEERVARYARSHPKLPCVLDAQQEKGVALAPTLGVGATPTLLLFDGNGKVVFASAGSIDSADVEEKIRLLLGAGKVVRQP